MRYVFHYWKNYIHVLTFTLITNLTIDFEKYSTIPSHLKKDTFKYCHLLTAEVKRLQYPLLSEKNYIQIWVFFIASKMNVLPKKLLKNDIFSLQISILFLFFSIFSHAFSFPHFICTPIIRTSKTRIKTLRTFLSF